MQPAKETEARLEVEGLDIDLSCLDVVETHRAARAGSSDSIEVDERDVVLLDESTADRHSVAPVARAVDAVGAPAAIAAIGAPGAVDARDAVPAVGAVPATDLASECLAAIAAAPVRSTAPFLPLLFPAASTRETGGPLSTGASPSTATPLSTPAEPLAGAPPAPPAPLATPAPPAPPSRGAPISTPLAEATTQRIPRSMLALAARPAGSRHDAPLTPLRMIDVTHGRPAFAADSSAARIAFTAPPARLPVVTTPPHARATGAAAASAMWAKTASARPMRDRVSLVLGEAASTMRRERPKAAWLAAAALVGALCATLTMRAARPRHDDDARAVTAHGASTTTAAETAASPTSITTVTSGRAVVPGEAALPAPASPVAAATAAPAPASAAAASPAAAAVPRPVRTTPVSTVAETKASAPASPAPRKRALTAEQELADAQLKAAMR